MREKKPVNYTITQSNN